MICARIIRLFSLALALAFFPAPALFSADSTLTAKPHRIVVDGRLSSAGAAAAPDTHTTLAAATAVLRPGDTLWIAPGSGPYREILHIKTSGTPEAPIIIEANDNEITGFEPIVFTEKTAATTTPWPFVLRHNGKRIPQDAATQNFTNGVLTATWDAAQKTLTLAPDAPTDGWEISARQFAVRISGVSHHTYRNLIATGSRNDGFNLHGDCTNLLFENITGAQNLDEGFSAHETVSAEIKGGRFYENDNGLFNINQSRLVLTDAGIYQNLGFGLAFNADATIEARNVRVWGNGMVQLFITGNVTASFENSTIYKTPYETRPWITYNETARREKPVTHSTSKTATWTGPKPRLSGETTPEK
ncbi:hypothetical protein OpiT1DRAFT_03354 [Opitutaceae bacterium TAV1]|nr:hypothetical protein OpiT1DRAFT_03354 [Opitutaceae bacterium TAV1]